MFNIQLISDRTTSYFSFCSSGQCFYSIISAKNMSISYSSCIWIFILFVHTKYKQYIKSNSICYYKVMSKYIYMQNIFTDVWRTTLMILFYVVVATVEILVLWGINCCIFRYKKNPLVMQTTWWRLVWSRRCCGNVG